MKEKIKSFFTVRRVGLFLAFLALISGFIGYEPGKFIENYSANIATELASIAITILVIDFLNEKRDLQNLKERLSRELWSKDQGIALRAINEMRVHNWHSDGSLNGIQLPYAILNRAELKGSKMCDANLKSASVQRAYLGHSQLKNVNFSKANLTLTYFNSSDLSGSDFTDSIVAGASFKNAILRDAKISKEQLSSAKTLQGAIMPNGQKFESQEQTQKVEEPPNPAS